MGGMDCFWPGKMANMFPVSGLVGLYITTEGLVREKTNFSLAG